MRSWPRFAQRRVEDLNDFWDFTVLGPLDDPRSVETACIQYDDRMPVPHCFDATPKYAGVRATVAYRRFIDIPRNTRARIEFGAVGMWCAVFIDGEKLTEHFDGYLPFAAEVPKSSDVHRELTVVVDNQFNDDRNPVQLDFYDWYHHGGISRPVYLHILPEVDIANVQITPVDVLQGLIDVSVQLDGESSTPVRVNFEIDGIPIQEDAVFSVGEAKTVRLALPDAAPWTPDSPVLHELTVRADHDDYSARFGLRKATVDDTRILINGSPVKLVGFGRHEMHPQSGSALTDAQIVEDVQLLLDMGCNFVRGAHYPQDPRFLDLCDEFGILVWEESTSWNNETKHYTDERFIDAQIRGLESMIRASYNHPCVIIRGFLNEGFNRREVAAIPLYNRLTALCRKLDPTRMVSAANVYFEGTAEQMPDMDIVSYNMYPGWYYYDIDHGVKAEIDEWVEKAIRLTGRKRPFLISEIGAEGLYGWHDRNMDRWSEDYQARQLDVACRYALENDAVAGIAIWTFNDFRSGENIPFILRRARGYNNKGVLDEYRRPKLAYDVVKKHFRGVTGRSYPPAREYSMKRDRGEGGTGKTF